MRKTDGQKAVGVAELKAHLSQYLREVGKGRTVTVVDRQRPVARLVPVETPAAPSLRVRKASKRLSAIALPPPLGRPSDVVATLEEERADR